MDTEVDNVRVAYLEVGTVILLCILSSGVHSRMVSVDPLLDHSWMKLDVYVCSTTVVKYATKLNGMFALRTRYETTRVE